LPIFNWLDVEPGIITSIMAGVTASVITSVTAGVRCVNISEREGGVRSAITRARVEIAVTSVHSVLRTGCIVCVVANDRILVGRRTVGHRLAVRSVAVRSLPGRFGVDSYPAIG